jgi:hydroxyversicolorone monooxygenase
MMAPEIGSPTSFKTNGYANNGVHPEAAYQIPDVVLHSPPTRKLRVFSVGGSVPGIMNAYKIEEHCENVEHGAYEKNEDIGGTRLEDKYPGCGCFSRICSSYK